MNNRLETLQYQLAQTTQMINAKDVEKSKNDTKIDTTSAEILSLQNNFTSMKSASSELENQEKELNTTLQDCQDDIERDDISKQITEIQTQIEEVDKSAKDIDKKIKNEQKKLQKHQTEKKNIEKEKYKLHEQQKQLEQEILNNKKILLLDESLRTEQFPEIELQDSASEKDSIEAFDFSRKKLPKVPKSDNLEFIVEALVKGTPMILSDKTQLYRKGSAIHLKHVFSDDFALDFETIAKDFSSYEAKVSLLSKYGKLYLDGSTGPKKEKGKGIQNEKRIIFGYETKF
ncbi:hypothetical protein IJG72_08405 [bacterium]|nr:hypothetical protein [bacterium]